MISHTPRWDDIPGGFPTATPASERDQFSTPTETTPSAGVAAIQHHPSVSPSSTLHPPTPTDPDAIGTTDLESDSPASPASSCPELVPIKTATENTPHHQSTLQRHPTTEDELIRALSRRRSSVHSAATGADDDENRDEIERLLSRIFGKSRQSASEEEKTRHVGVVWRHLTVKGIGIGASLKATNSDILLGPLRAIWDLASCKHFRRGKPVRTLIHDFTGIVKPQEMCLVLARPGGGASTFLKTMANQRSGFVAVEGDVLYGGETAKVMQKNFRNEVMYQPEDDLHHATLTVEETLKFALKTRTPGKQSRKEGESRSDYVKEFLHIVSKLFWIEHTLKTKVGDEVIRGVSGGEKKRVSIAEAIVTKASCQCWDNSTRGLDASTATEYVSSLRALTNMVKISTFVALYQAGEGLYDLFDKVILIHEGHCAYFGPTEDAKAYFEELGFECPPRWTTADFLTSVTDIHARRIKKGWEDRIPRTPEEFDRAYRNSQIAKRTVQEIDQFEQSLEEQKKARAQEMTKNTQQKNFEISFPLQVYECAARQFKVLKGDPASLYGKWGGILFQSLIVGSLFYNLPASALGAFPRGGIMFLTLLFNSLLALSELTAAFSSRPIILKQKSFCFYRPSAYALGLVIADIPQVAVQTILWSLVIYFMTGLQRTASQFFIFLLITFVLTLTLYSFFRALASFSASLDVASRLTGIAIQALVVYTGYLIPPGAMHPWFSWIRWINPVQYSFEALMANEFTGMEINCEPPYLVPPPGPNITPEYQSCLLQGSKPGEPSVSGSDYISTAFTYSRSHLWRNFGIVCGFWIFFAVLTMIGMERLKPNKGGAAVTVYKRGQVPSEIKKAIKEGDTGPPNGDEEKGDAVDHAAAGQGQGPSDDADKQIAKNDTVFTWQDVTYTIPTKKGDKVLLKNVNGYVRPGRLTALMGESGAGKTTLLNALSQRLSFGTVKGTFLVDGRPLPISFQRSTGFAEQQDTHEPNQTVREALRFSAALRQPADVPIKEKYEYVEHIIDLLEMRDLAGAIVGTMGEGLNQEQKKRLTIGVELAAKPELLFFLDEPTSGLDSQAAWNIVRFLRKLADAGQAILCTIHQPSAILFEEFDDLLLLKSGGQVVYHGPLGKDSQEMIQYFERNGAQKCPPDRNPAEYMLDAIGAGDPNRSKEKDWADVWRNSPESKRRAEEIEKFIAERSSAKQSTNKSQSKTANREFATSWGPQTIAVIRRAFVSYWRAPEYVIGMFALHILTALFNAFTFYKLGNSSIDMQSRLFSVFMTLTIAPPLIQQLQPKYLAFRDLFSTRERASKTYAWTSFVTAAILVEIPYRLVAGTLYFAAWYWPIGFPRDSGTAAFTWALIMMFELYYTGFGMFIAALAPNELLASMLVPLFFLFVASFCGVVVPYNAMPTFWRSWMYWLSPFTHLINAFLPTLAHNQPVRCEEDEAALVRLPPSVASCEEYLGPVQEMAGMGSVESAPDGMCRVCQFATGDEFSKSFNFEYSNRWRSFGIFWAYIVFNFALVYIFTWMYLGGVKRVMKRFKSKGKSTKKGEQREHNELEREKRNDPADVV